MAGTIGWCWQEHVHLEARSLPSCEAAPHSHPSNTKAVTTAQEPV